MNLKKTITNDSSITFYNDQVNDYYHSKSGAKEEAVEKHAKALQVHEIENPIIFDICFGLGYNTAAALDILKKATIFCFENDLEILKKILEIEADFSNYNIIKNFIKNYLEKKETTYQEKGFKLIMIFGDVKEKIKEVKVNADFVFFDPFSPLKVPEMWNPDFLKNIKDKMKKGAKLSTYSFSKQVQNNFQEAGFTIKKGPIVGRFSPSLIAINM